MPIQVTDARGKMHYVSITETLFGGGRTIVRKKGPIKSALQTGETAGDAAKRKLENPAGTQSPDKQDSTRTDEGNADGPKADAGGNADEGQKADAAGPNDSAAWTKEEEKELLELKAGGSTWAQIGAKLGKAKKDTQQRYGELRATETKDEKTEKPKESSTSKKTNVSLSGNATTSPKDLSKTLWDEAGATIDPLGMLAFMDSMSLADSPDTGAASFDCVSTLNVDEALLLAQLQKQFDHHKWFAMATHFYSLTGKRIDPSLLKDAASHEVPES